MTAPILPGFIVLFFPPPLNFYQSHLPHLLGQGEGAGFLQIQKGLDVLVGDLPVLPDVFQDFFHLGGEDRRAILNERCRCMGGVLIGQDDLEGIGRHFDPGLGGASGIQGVNAADAGSVLSDMIIFRCFYRFHFAVSAA